MTAHMAKHSCKSVVVSIDSYDDGIPTGQFWSVGNQNDKYVFSNMTQLILGIDSVMDDDGHIDGDAFVPSPYILSMPHAIYHKVLLIKIFFRQHSSWQGSVTDLINGTVTNFKSVLEVMGILDSALGESCSAESC